MLIKKHFFNVVACALFSTQLLAQQTTDTLVVESQHTTDTSISNIVTQQITDTIPDVAQTTDSLKTPVAVQSISTPTILDSVHHKMMHAKNNIVKFNLSALIVNNYSFQYERKLSKRFTIAANFHVRPFSQLPFISQITKAANSPTVNFNKFRLGNAGVTPELRYYVGKKGAFHGFYFGAMFNNTNYNLELPINYSGYTGTFTGQLNTQSVGLQLGAQWQLSKRLYLDWWILGPSSGSQKGNLVLKAANLSPMQQYALNYELNDLKTNDKIFKNFIDSYSVNSNGAVINSKGPWGAIRAFGINLGIAF